MKYLLDSNVCIQYLNQRSEKIIQRLQDLSDIDIVVCSIVKAELFYGAMRTHNPAKTLQKQQEFLNRFISLKFDDECAVFYGEICSKLAAKGTPNRTSSTSQKVILRSRNAYAPPQLPNSDYSSLLSWYV
jgi:tRNA(fMet)-specific endonuclease VapC